MLDVWTQSSGYSLGTYPNLSVINIILPLNTSSVVCAVISGKLPTGLQFAYSIDGIHVVGEAYKVISDTTYSFCIRASNGYDFADRTFTITITGEDAPIIDVPSEQLPIGIDYQYYTYDNVYVYYQFHAIELVTAGIDGISFIASGELPPGLTLSKSGLLSGTVRTLKNTFPDNLSFNYQFSIIASNGFHTDSQTCAIYVVGPDYLTVDNTNLLVDNGLFTADIANFRPLQWTTESDLGSFHSNDFLIIPFTVVDNRDVTFEIIDEFGDPILDTSSILPPDTVFDENIGTISGYVKRETTNSKDYSLIIRASKLQSSISKLFKFTMLGDITSDITWNDAIETPAIFKPRIRNGLVENIAIVDGGTGYTGTTTISIIANNPGVTVQATAKCVVFNGSITYLEMLNTGAGYTIEPTVMLSHSLGTLVNNQLSEFVVSATSSLNKQVMFSIIDGDLPPGLTMYSSGDISGKIIGNGATTFTDVEFEMATTFDNKFVFTVLASDQYSTSLRSFSIDSMTSISGSFSNVYSRPLMPENVRMMWSNFINNSDIFPTEFMYRSFDPNFGIQTSLSMLIYAGIQTTTVDVYTEATLLNNAKKRFLIGDVSIAYANTSSGKSIYEVIYIQIQDPSEIDNKHLLPSVEYNGETYYPNSISEWRYRLSTVLNTNGEPLAIDQTYLPSWMRTITPTQTAGFKMGVPICYCKPGKASTILLNIQNYLTSNLDNFKLNQIDYMIDRYNIDVVTDQVGEVSIIFENNRTKI